MRYSDHLLGYQGKDDRNTYDDGGCGGGLIIQLDETRGGSWENCMNVVEPEWLQNYC